MFSHPFTLLKPHADRLLLDFLLKADDVHDDVGVGRATGHSRTVGLRQMHGNVVHVVREPSSRTLQGDGLITDVPGLALTIRFADCQGLVVYAPAKNVVGLIHAGWRGVVAGVIPSFFLALKDEWDINPDQVIVGIGPSLCLKCADFTDPAHEVPSLQKYTVGRCVDLQAAADAQLAELGVPASAIERSPDCTRCNPEKYWTYRGGHREEVTSGCINAFAVSIL
jgi:polyphenol oxidase